MATVRARRRRCPRPGLRGLVPDEVAIVPQGTPPRGPQTGVDARARLQARSAGWQDGELARMLWCTGGDRPNPQPVKKLWQDRPAAGPGAWAWGASHRHAAPSQARGQVRTLSDPGWTTRRIRHGWQVSRPSVDRWMRRCAAAPCAGLEDNSRAPTAPARQGWFPLRRDVSHGPKRHPAAGAVRLGSRLASTERSVSTVGRLMARQKQVDAALPQVHPTAAPPPPPPPPSTAPAPPQGWFLAGRMRDVAVDGVQWGRLLMPEGASRTMRAGAGAPAAARGVAWMVLSTACRRAGAPETVRAARGGACISTACQAGGHRLGSPQEPSKRHTGPSSVHAMEPPCPSPRRWFADPCA